MVRTIGGVQYLTIEEFAVELRVSESTVKRWIDEGLLIYWQIRERSPIRIPISELTRYLQQ